MTVLNSFYLFKKNKTSNIASDNVDPFTTFYKYVFHKGGIL